MDLGPMNYNNNSDQIYYHFTTILSNTINNFLNDISFKKSNRNSNPWYDQDCKISRKTIRDAPIEIIKLQNTNIYKIINKRK